MPIYEPGLEEMVRRNHAEERLTFTTDLPAAVQASEIVFIAVGTPQGEDGSADLQHVLGVARDIGRAIEQVHGGRRQEHGAGRHRAARCARRSPSETTQPFSVVSNPEFLKQGAAIEDFMKPDRVVIGSDDERSAAADAGAVRAVHADRRADHDDGHGERRAVQVRGELDSRDPHLVHERDRQRLRAGRRRRRPGAQGDRRPTGASARRSCFPASATAAAAFPKDVKALLQVVGATGATTSGSCARSRR